MDSETGQLKWIDTGDKQIRTHFAAVARRRDAYLKEIFNRSGVDSANICTSDSYIQPLMNLFKKREAHR
jgi:hypothetical protein